MPTGNLECIRLWKTGNMQVGYRKGNKLPVENLPGETKEGFTYRVIEMINNDSVVNVVKVVNTEVKFA
mgnify:CR=1 FL=1